MEAGKIEIAPEAINISAVLQDCCEMQQDLVASHRIVVEMKGLPDELIADPSSLTQIITNLLSNAVKYSPDADRVDVRAHRNDDFIIISVQDFGIGVDEDEHDQMFGRFFRASTSVGIPGTGIGLNLSKMLAEEHGGSITMCSRKGEGSTFTLYLPLAIQASGEKSGCSVAC